MQKVTLSPDIGLLLRAAFQRNNQLFLIITLLMIIVAIHDWSATTPVVVQDIPSSPPPVAAVVEPEKPASPLPNVHLSSPMPYMDIPEFNEANSHEQSYIDWLKERYEAWLITYYYLHKCNQADESDFIIIKAALHNDLEAAHAQPEVENNILGAATGSYQEMYKDIACDNASIGSSKASYLTNMQQLHSKSSATPLK